MSAEPWTVQTTHPFKPRATGPLLTAFKCAILNLLFSADYHSDSPRSHAFGFYSLMERETNEHVYFDDEETVPQWVMDRLKGAKYLHVELETGHTSNYQLVDRTSSKGKAIFQIQVRASIRNEKLEVGVDAEEGPVYWSLTVQFELDLGSYRCKQIGNWNWVIRLLRDAAKGGFKKDGSPAGGAKRATAHYMVGTLWIATDKTGLPSVPNR